MKYNNDINISFLNDSDEFVNILQVHKLGNSI